MRRKHWALVGAAALAAVIVGGVVVMFDGKPAAPAAQEQAVNTATVQEAKLSYVVYQDGTLTYRAQSDGSPYGVIDQARGTYTMLPDAGEKIDCGAVLYRVDDKPVVLLCGATPAYRSLLEGDSGADVSELNADLVRLGYATEAQLDPSSDDFSAETAAALRKLQSKLGADQTGSLALGQAVFLPEPSVRIATVTGELAGSARPGMQVLSATSDTLEVQVALDPSQQGEVKRGDGAQITLPDNTTVTGKVDRLGAVTQIAPGQTGAGAATIPAYISLDHPERVRGLDQAPVQVQITTRAAASALCVPVGALVGKSGGGFAIEVVGDAGRRELVAVKLGLFDDAVGLVQVQGDLRVGEHVAMASS